MKTKNIFLIFLYFILFFAAQILIFRNVALFNFAFCFIYIGFIILLPIEFPVMLILLISFFYGLMVDIFYDTMGIHTAATVLIAYMRSYIINLLTPRGGYDTSTEISIPSLGLQWFATYALILIAIHHFSLFLVESWGMSVALRMIGKTVLSSIFTLVVLILFQYLFYPAKSFK